MMISWLDCMRSWCTVTIHYLIMSMKGERVQVNPMWSSIKSEDIIPFLNAQHELSLHFWSIISISPLSLSHFVSAVNGCAGTLHVSFTSHPVIYIYRDLHCDVHWIYDSGPSVPWIYRVIQWGIMSIFAIRKRVRFTGPVGEHAGNWWARVEAWCKLWVGLRKLLWNSTSGWASIGLLSSCSYDRAEVGTPNSSSLKVVNCFQR